MVEHGLADMQPQHGSQREQDRDARSAGEIAQDKTQGQGNDDAHDQRQDQPADQRAAIHHRKTALIIEDLRDRAATVENGTLRGRRIGDHIDAGAGRAERLRHRRLQIGARLIADAAQRQRR